MLCVTDSHRAMESNDSSGRRWRSSASRLPPSRRSTSGKDGVRDIVIQSELQITFCQALLTDIPCGFLAVPPLRHAAMLCIMKRMEPTVTVIEGESLPKRMKDAREAAKLSQFEAAMALRDYIPKSILKPTNATISRIETGETAEPEVYVICGLAKVYGRFLEDLAPEYVDDARRISELCATMDLYAPGALFDLRGAKSSCTADSWVVRPIVERRRPYRPVVEILMRNESSGSYAKAS